MLDGAPAKLLQEWMAFAQLEPFGEARADLRNAINCMATANAFGMKKRGGGDFTFDDFIPKFNEPAATTLKEVDPVSAQAILRQRYGNNSKSGG